MTEPISEQGFPLKAEQVIPQEALVRIKKGLIWTNAGVKVPLGNDPNWNLGMSSLAPGEKGETRLCLGFHHGGTGETRSFDISSRALAGAHFDREAGIFWIESDQMRRRGGRFGEEKVTFAMRITQEMGSNERAALEWILGLKTGNENLIVSRKDDIVAKFLEVFGWQLKLRESVVSIDGEKAGTGVKGRKDTRAEVIRTRDLSDKEAKGLAGDSRRTQVKPELSQLAGEKRGGIKVQAERMVIHGRSGEDRVASLAPERLAGNRWGIEIMEGVFDGHGGSRVAEKALFIFWSHLGGSRGENFFEAIREAAIRTDETIKRQGIGFRQGACAEIAVKTKEGLVLLHLGDGAQVWQTNGGHISREDLEVHHPPRNGRVGGVLAVNGAFGDSDLKDIHGIKRASGGISPVPDIRFYSNSDLRKKRAVLLTSDGLVDLGYFAQGAGLTQEAIIQSAFNSGLGVDFQSKVEQAKAEWQRQYQSGKVNAPSDDISVLLLKFT